MQIVLLCSCGIFNFFFFVLLVFHCCWLLGSSACFRPTLKIFLFPLTRPRFSGMGRSVGNFFFLTSQIPYPLNLIVKSPNIGN